VQQHLSLFHTHTHTRTAAAGLPDRLSVRRLTMAVMVSVLLAASWSGGSAIANRAEPVGSTTATVQNSAVAASGFVVTDLVAHDVRVAQVGFDDGHQTLLRIDGPASPTVYRFEDAVPAGVTATVVADGSVSLADGSTIAAPWAFDANGAAVDTWYELDGTTLVQHVDHFTVEAYPVVADPCWWGWKCAKKIVKGAAGGAALGAVVGCGVGAAAGLIVASGPGCATGAAYGAINGGIGGAIRGWW
jgi:hypothetical protein